MTLLGSEHSILIRSKFRSVLQLRLQQRRTREQLEDQGLIMPLNQGKFSKREDSYVFEEDSSSESFSSEQNLSDESQGSGGPSSEAVGHTTSSSSSSSSSSSPNLTSPLQVGASKDSVDQNQDEGLNGTSLTTPPIPVPAIVKSKTADKNRHKKPKDVKPKVKKLKYHQYIPPDQKAEKSPPPMDSAYARLLQQQQLFLQLQILSQQKHSERQGQHQNQNQSTHTPPVQQRQPAFSYQPHPQVHNHKTPSEQIPACGSSGPSSAPNSNSSSPVKSSFANQSNISPVKPGPLPTNLDDLKVSELRQQLRIRGMPVSGTKTALIERLRPFRDSNAGSSPSGSSDITTVTFPVTPTGSLSSYQSPSSSSVLSQGGYFPYPSTSSTPPISPASSELSLSGSLPDSFSDVPMSSPTHFGLQGSPSVPLGMEDGGLGGGRAQRSVEGGAGEGLEAEKDKMLVEKQKVIEELTWKLHQEQRQVEELKMQLHSRKRCYGATQENHPAPPHPPGNLHHHHHPHQHQQQQHQQNPAMMTQHFFGVTVKQEPMALTSSCPLSSPKQLKSPVLDELGHASTSMSCMDSASSASSSVLAPQSSSPPGKASSSPQPSSPPHHHPQYLQTPSLSRDHGGLLHHHNRAGGNLQMQQQKNANCSYNSDQRNLQGDFPNAGDCGLNHNTPTKTETQNQNLQPKISCRPLVSSASFGSSSDSPPCYEDAVKQQLSRSQQMDELLDVLIENGGCPGLLIPRCHRHYDHQYQNLTHYDHPSNHVTESHLETLLGAPIGRGGEAALLKMAAEDGGLEDDGPPNGHHHHHHRHLLDKHPDTPLSPLGCKVPTLPEVMGMVNMAFSEWETMEWLDLMPPSSAAAFGVPPPGIFNAEFPDATDMNLHAAVDLQLDHW